MTYFKELEGKSVLVTGGGKGIGKDIALSFAKLGAKVVITGRNIDHLENTTTELQQYNSNCHFISTDLTHTNEIKNMVDETAQLIGTVDILVNNAGINIAKPSLNITEEEWDLMINTNLKAAFFCSQAAAKYMIPKKVGKIINIASQMAFVGYWNRAPYCASKGGMVQLTKALSIEWAAYNININAVAPTFIETELTSKMFEDDNFKNDVYSRIPMGRLAKPADVSGAVLYLASDMAQLVTGETIKVDGGWTAI